MKSFTKEEILASSNGWIASLLNIIPGIGAGYLYQRRWLPYLITTTSVFIWIITGILIQRNQEPSQAEQIIGLAGLFIISIITSIEANIAYKKSVKLIDEKVSNEKKNLKKKGWFK